MSLQNAQPQVIPTDPAYQPMNKQDEQNKTLVNILEGSSKVNEFVKENPKFVIPKLHEYIVPGGSKKSKNDYSVSYKNVSYCVKAGCLLEAAQDGYIKMVNNIPNFSKKKIRINVQRKNKNRENHVHQFLVKKEDIKNPKYRSKITFQKL